jgi:hypothetical protein
MWNLANEGIRIEIPTKSKANLGLFGTFPIKLIYSSHSSIIVQVPSTKVLS